MLEVCFQSHNDSRAYSDLLFISRTEYRALEGFVLAISPFNFTAIGGNLVASVYYLNIPVYFTNQLLCLAPSLVGNVCVWKPSPMAVYANYLTHQIFSEAGVPPGVIQFIPGPAEPIVAQAIAHPSFAALHFTGSTFVFKKLWKDIAANVGTYKTYPRLVGETGGKNWHVIHKSAEVRNAVTQTVRGAFEYQGQKCSALSRAYVSRTVWEQGGFREQLLEEVAKLKVGPPQDFTNFIGPVMYAVSYRDSAWKLTTVCLQWKTSL